ncbi:MAG: hypothetical protein KC572_11915, partial [Gammaproteobacteria bacterium]|nr:hypothetical protein [Gammaproteobacteria bacterium]
MKRTALVLIGALLLASFPAFAAWEANVDDKLQVKAAAAIDRLRERVPRTQAYFEQAYAFAIFPSVTRIGLGFGGAYGRGIVIEGDSLVGRSKYKQFTSGIQAGARNFSMIVFFKDREALEYYQTGKTQFMGQAGIALGSFGA